MIWSQATHVQVQDGGLSCRRAAQRWGAELCSLNPPHGSWLLQSIYQGWKGPCPEKSRVRGFLPLSVDGERFVMFFLWGL